MSLQIVFNPFTGKFDYINATTGAVIPEFTSDPVSPTPEETWVLHTPGVTGTPIGLLLSLTRDLATTGTYELSYYTLEGTIKRVALT